MWVYVERDVCVYVSIYHVCMDVSVWLLIMVCACINISYVYVRVSVVGHVCVW